MGWQLHGMTRVGPEIRSLLEMLNGGGALLVINPTGETLTGLPVPQVIIASKPDVYDNQAALAEYVREQGFRLERSFTAFVIWRRGGN